METCAKHEAYTEPVVNRSWLAQRLLELPEEIAKAESDLLKLSEKLELIRQFPDCEARVIRRRLILRLPVCYTAAAARFAYLAAFLPANGWDGDPIITTEGDVVLIEGDVKEHEEKEQTVRPTANGGLIPPP